ncbi:hypothetical protein BDZ94DRAFT_1293737 [Collybia nuda]|uniref:Protein kinase domain-containing protein n=1 Tax=Collybia nuda TaxID=64659 RepID=A0A9P5YHF2_9AGAR|nr:hypothetical protein BDZ94DRAFT_1293737 [Collybia nuda]
MAQARRSPHNRVSPSPSVRKYPLRRSPPSRRHRNASEDLNLPTDLRPVLVTLHPNLRRLPSRLHLSQPVQSDKPLPMAQHAFKVGSKRKRVASINASNENVSQSSRTSRSKRLRSDVLPTKHRRYDTTTEEEGEEGDEEVEEDTEDEDQPSEMDIDTASTAQMSASDDSEPGEQDSDIDDNDNDGEEQGDCSEDDEDNSTDDHLINSAQPKQLSRLRKVDLIRLYELVGLSDDAEALTKSEIVDAIISARDDLAELPPSSPPGRGDGNSSDYCSSDDGNVAGDEETDIGGPSGSTPNQYMGLRRRATIGDVSKNVGRPIKGRSMSMGHLLAHHEANGLLVKRKTSGASEPSKRKVSKRLSPTTSTSISTPSPLATRLRSRKVSASSTISGSSADPVTPTYKTSSKGRGKGKGKQVEFSEAIEEVGSTKTPSRRGREKEREKEKERQKTKEREREKERIKIRAEESDLTELEDLEQMLGKPSPRRLRSKDRGMEVELEVGAGASEVHFKKSLRKTPMRKAKVKMGSLKEDDTEEDELEEGMEGEEVEEEQEEDELLGDDDSNVANDEDEDGVEEEEVDELVSSASATPTPPPPFKGRRTPLRRRLRPRTKPVPPPSDGDDEGGAEEDDGEGENIEDVEGEEGMEEVEDDDDDDDDDDETIAVEPRKLRNGKIVGDEDVEMDEEEDIGEEDDDEEEDEECEGEGEGEENDEEGEDASVELEGEEEDEGVDVEEIDIDAEGETDEDEVMEDEDDIDLTVATTKTLVRLRRDDLVRLCETRDLEPVGTKPQLAEALLQWRDRQANDFSSPSSSGTVRPPSTKRRHRRHQTRNSDGTTPPILLRSEHFHQDEPRTPPVKEKEPEPELELDLESLGLEDREIPPEKLQKLEKIGSGGFKDVFIGKFKGRKIAISEFRGQLSAMDIKELKLLGGFDHPNIVRFLGVSIPENTRETPVMIVSELCSNGDLFDYVRNVNAPTLHKVLVMMLDIARGLEYLHLRKPSVIHRDCKSSNILITAKGTAKIADFGLAKVKQSTRSMVRSLVGTVNWQAPELWHAHPKYNHKVDVFSCAMVYWEMLQWHMPNKKFPWEGMNEHAIYEIVGTKRQRPSLTGLRKQWCPEIIDLIERMWAQDHSERPTMSEVVEALEELVTNR